MVFEFAGHTNEPFYSEQERRLLMTSKVAPSRKVTVNVATYAGSAYCTAFHHFVGYDVPKHPTIKTMIGHCSTITLGQFVVQVFSMHFNDDFESVFEIPVRSIEGGWHQYTAGIWPHPRDSVAWPQEALDDHRLVLFMNRWNVGPLLEGPPALR
jgi:hypothetical protein